MNAEQLALLQLIAGGNYLPYTLADYPTLASLYRRRFIRYGWMAVEITAAGSEALELIEQKEAS